MNVGRIDRTGAILMIAAFAAMSLCGFCAYAVPFPTIRTWLDSASGDGSADRYTLAIHARLTELALAVAIVGLLVTVGLIWNFLRLERALQLIRCNVNSEIRGLCYVSFRSKWTPISLLVVSIVFCMLAVPELGAPIRSDEAHTVVQYTQVPLFVTVTRYDAPNNHVLHSICVHLVTQVAGNSVVAIRSVAFLSGLICLWIVLLWSASLDRLTTGFAASLILATHPTFQEYSVNARGYTMSAMWILIAAWGASIVAMRGGISSKFSLIIGSSLAMFTIPTNFFAVWLIFASAILFVALIRYASWKRSVAYFMVSGLAVILITGFLYLPIIATSDSELIQSLLHRKNPSTSRVFQQLQTYSVHLYEWFMWRVPLWGQLLLLVGIISAIASQFRPVDGHRSYRSVRVAATFSIAMAILSLPVIFELQSQLPPERTWFFLIPFSMIMVASGWQNIANSISIKAAIPLTIFMCAAISFSTLYTLWTKPLTTENRQCNFAQSEEIASWFEANAMKDGPIIAVTPCSAPIIYQMRRRGTDGKHFFVPGKGLTDDRHALLIASNEFGQSPHSVLKELRLDDRFQDGEWSLVQTFSTARIYKFKLSIHSEE